MGDSTATAPTPTAIGCEYHNDGAPRALPKTVGSGQSSGGNHTHTGNDFDNNSVIDINININAEKDNSHHHESRCHQRHGLKSKSKLKSHQGHLYSSTSRGSNTVL
mmetsp:Transcript_24644/g.54034  ORF Transcript_24644/g.54034 Transcript_24644/m.54034 type:complete len:106 (-) Transcript_24644:218-535(-)